MRLLDARSYAVGPSLRASVTLVFERGSVDVEIATTSRFVKGELRLEAVVAARAFGRRAIDKAFVTLFRGSKMAVRRAAAAAVQALAALQDALRLPPPIDLGGGKLLRLAYCTERPMEIRERLVATIPMRVVLERAPKGHAVRGPVDLPPRRPPPHARRRGRRSRSISISMP